MSIYRNRISQSSRLKKDNNKASKDVLNEVSGILLIAIAIFIVVSRFYPETTGVLGHYMVERFIRRFFGIGLFVLPVFISVIGLALLIRKSYSNLYYRLTGLFIGFLSFITLAEIFNKGYIEKLVFPITYNGGGITGYILAYLLERVFGLLGSKIILGAFLIVSMILLFNITLASILTFLKVLLVKVLLLEKKEKAISKKSIMDKRREEFYRQRNKKKGGISGFLKEVFSFNANKSGVKESSTEKASKDVNQAARERYFREKRMRTLRGVKENKPYVLTEKGFRKKTEVEQKVSDGNDDYCLPPFDLLKPAALKHTKDRQKITERESLILEETLASFGVEARVVSVSQGPAVTRYELQPAPGVKVSKITNLANDIALQLAAQAVRIEAPIPGKAMVGIEVPNSDVDIVNLSAIIKSTDFYEKPSKLVAGLGLTLAGESVLIDLPKMPHLLIAGATGSGKSVCINSLIISLLMKAKPSEVKFLMIDPKKVEFSIYEDIPHLLAPVVTDPRKAAATLKQWALKEMDRRYEEFSRMGARNIEGYNKLVENMDKEDLKRLAEKSKTENYTDPYSEKEELTFIPSKLPYIVVIIDELADLMLVASNEVENAVCRLAQMARATGIHLVVSTQRPSVDVITGLIKANIPSRVSFAVSSQIDSRTILDMVGAEKLLGRGDMLYSPVGSMKPIRLQGVFISDKEIEKVTKFVKKQAKPEYLNEIMEVEPLPEKGAKHSGDGGRDDLFEEAKNIVISSRQVSTSYLQRRLRIGYNRAARLMDELEEAGIISSYEGENKARHIIGS